MTAVMPYAATGFGAAREIAGAADSRVGIIGIPCI
jgi:hypothetical protein